MTAAPVVREAGRPSIAIVIMSYNRPDTIVPTIESLLGQDCPLSAVDGVYLADDCSTDATVAVAQAAWRSDRALTLLQPPRNAGTWGNVNQALARLSAAHDWVLVLHDDDLVKPSWLGTFVDRIQQCAGSTATICSSWDSLHIDGSIEPGEDDPLRPVAVIDGKPDAVRGTLLKGCWWHFSGCAIRTSAFRAIGGFDAAFPQCSDQEWLMRGLSRGWSVEYVPRTLLVYRQHAGSLSSRSFRVHQDLVEQLRMTRQHRGVLSRGDLVRLHARVAGFLARRGVRAILRGQTAAAVNAAKLAPRVAASCAGCLRAPSV